jgi:hypothetical protein
MTGPRCEYCGHINRAGAEFCEACDFNAGGPRPAAGEPPGQGSPADAIPAPPFKTAGDVISPMLAVYRKHFTTVGILVLVTTLPQSLLSYGVIEWAVVSGGTGGIGGAAGGFGSGSLLLWVVTIVAAALLSGSLVYAVVDLQRAGGSSAGECLARGLKSLPKVFVVSLLQSVMTWVGFILLIVPGVILSLMFAVCVPAAVVEGLGPVGALKRSHELTQGRKGLIFITYFLWGLLVMLLNWVVVWSFARGGSLDPLSAILLQTAVLGMLNSSLHVLTVYIYLGLLRERRVGFRSRAFTQDAGAAAG